MTIEINSLHNLQEIYNVFSDIHFVLKAGIKVQLSKKSGSHFHITCDARSASINFGICLPEMPGECISGPFSGTQ